MSNLPLDRTVRLRAMWCSLSGIIWVPILFSDMFSTLLFNAPIVNQPLGYDGVMLLTVLMPIIFWQINRQLHPFIDLVGKASVNLALTYLCPIVLVLCMADIHRLYVLYVGRINLAYIHYFYSGRIIIQFFLTLIFLTHLFIIFCIASAAIKGEMYNYRWKFNFFK